MAYPGSLVSQAWMNQGDAGIAHADPGSIGAVPVQADAAEPAHLIATFDDATAGPAAMRADPVRYELTGIFADPSLDGWNNFDDRPDTASVGDASVSTWEIGTLKEAQATGSIRINGIAITGKYLNFLMAGGGSARDGGRANVGVTLFVAGTSMALAAHSPDHCADRYLKGDGHWTHINVSALADMVVDMEIHDHDAKSNCGFIAFDHFYQSDQPRGQPSAGAAARPDMR